MDAFVFVCACGGEVMMRESGESWKALDAVLEIGKLAWRGLV